MDMPTETALLFAGTAGIAAYFFVQWTKAKQVLDRFDNANAKLLEELQELTAIYKDKRIHENCLQTGICTALHGFYKASYGIDATELYNAVKNGTVPAARKQYNRRKHTDYPDAPMM